MNLFAKKHSSKNKKRSIGEHIQHYSSKKGIIKGIKTMSRYIYLYLVEFADHNRVWIIEKEITQ